MIYQLIDIWAGVKLSIESNLNNMKIRLIHSVTIVTIFILRIFYSSSIQNISENIYNLFNYKVPEIRYVTYFFLIMSIFINAFLRNKNTLNQIIFWFLTLINLFLIILSFKI